MEENFEYEIELSWIMLAEHQLNWNLPYKKRVPEELRDAAYHIFAVRNKFYREDVLLEKENCKSFENLIDNHAAYYHDGSSFIENEKRIRKIFNLWEYYCFKTSDLQYELFFAYKLKHTSIFSIDGFLNHQLIRHHENNKKKFSRFLMLLFRVYDHVLSDAKKKITVEEWIASINDDIEVNIKKKKVEKVEKNIEDIIFDDCLEQFYKIEKRLIRDGYLITMNDGNLKWNKTKEQLIAVIMIFYHHGYYNQTLFDQKPYEYRKVFEKQYNISLEQEFKKNRRSKINVESYMPIFSFIRHPLSSRR